MKVFTYKADPLAIVFILLFLIVSFAILSAHKLKATSTMTAFILSFISTYLLLSSEQPLTQSIEQVGFLFMSYLCLFFSVVDCKGKYIDKSIHRLTYLDEVEEYKHRSSCVLSHHYFNPSINSYHSSSQSLFNEQGTNIATFDDTSYTDDTTHSNIHSHDYFDSLNTQEVNPATGLLSFGGIDTNGNPNGCNLNTHSFDSGSFSVYS
ncbi:hypothetical protein AB4425_17845 [Vibrio sp. 10N.261.51.A1]|uniref:Uncharacterized protein n=2 Tax=Vibrionaceae TaxID=641 RepID=A0A7Z1MGQ7_9VIBR|nr:hypothetical protein [Vibrio sp. F13]PMK82309.1 hypothetical protein BCT92_13855 [Vibrio sp. 10N.261.52.E5]PMP17826.1 hypothetical protein BCS91_25420 [Vibrio cyclitrophicus]PMP26712.1 hypothetical protein BCS90_01555 [Vibrio cyclitrophicus]TKF94593.1 hypothetical protein FCV67_24645 [Vibrio sp. F13]